MEKKYNGTDRRLAYLFDNANHVEVDRIQTAGNPVADIIIDGKTTRLYAPQGGGGTDVEANPVGTPTADLDTIRIGQVIYDIPGGYTYLPVIYSEQEHEVGVWTDGKPLYQKTISVGAISAGNDVRVTAPANIGEIISIGGSAHSSNYNQWVDINFPHQNITAYIVTSVYLVSSNEFNIHTGTDFSLDKCYLTVTYTKTTDQPGSGTWTPDGEYAHHYSTAEQVVGTWIDGNTVYEKTFTGFSVTLQSGVLKDTGINVSYISKVISFTALSDDYLATIPVAGYKINGTLQMIGYQNGNVIDKCIVRYTKTQ